MSDHDSATRELPRWHPNPHVRATIETIRRSGWRVIAVSDSCDCDSPRCSPPDCAFAYTAGLGLRGIPELAIYGLDPHGAIRALNEVALLLHNQDWQTIVASRAEISLSALPVAVRLIEIIDKDDMLMANLLFPDSAALQVVWPDEFGYYPWEPGYALLPMHQKIVGTDDSTAHLTRPRVILTVDDDGNRVTPIRPERRPPRTA